MANLSEDIQCVGTDTRPPMLDRTDFASWQQQKDMYNAKICATNILLQGLPKDIHSLINHYTDAKDIWDNVKMLLEGSELTKKDRESQLNQAIIQDGKVVIQNIQGRQNRGQGNNTRGTGAAGYGGAQNRVGYANPGQARQNKCYNCNGICHIVRNCTQPKRPQKSKYFKDKMLLMQAQENGVTLDEEQLLFIVGGQDNVVDDNVDKQPIQDSALNVDNVFQADDCDDFDSDVNEAPTAQTMFMANLLSADLVYDEAGPSNNSNILSEVHDHDHYQDAICEHHEVHEMHDDVQPKYVVDSHTSYMSDSNMILYDQHVKRELHQRVSLKEKGFEQTKECYLIEVILFFKTLKEHFEGIQKALTTKFKEIKTIFDELEAEVDQNAVNRKCDEIEWKNLLIANDTIIANCLSKEVLYIATNSELNVSRFSEMHDAYTVVQARCLELETEHSKLKDKIQKEDHDVMLKHFSNLEITALLTENENLKVQIDAKLKCVTIYSVTPKVLAPSMYAIDVKPIPPPLRLRNNREVYLNYLKHLKKSVATLREIVEEAKFERPLDRSAASACLYTKHS
uniref:Retrovirus-related Pol polyprotein from transposon TNT 1-94 n=1 Tax=Tanacetum cinerariifolium TaxID=118510 RepID=A0A6L2KZ23_TANCI|nr:hypothetical protein [Tanacetum cinerariifolium]